MKEREKKKKKKFGYVWVEGHGFVVEVRGTWFKNVKTRVVWRTNQEKGGGKGGRQVSKGAQPSGDK